LANAKLFLVYFALKFSPTIIGAAITHDLPTNLSNMSTFLRLFFSLSILLTVVQLNAQVAGDLAIIGFNADGNDDLAIVTLAEIPADRTIYIRDDEWSGTAFRDAIESTLAWSTGSAAIPAGTVIVFSDLSTTMAVSIGTIVQVGTGNRGLAATDEAIFFYLGTDANTPTTFLHMVTNGTIATAAGSLDGTGLIAGTSALLLKAGADVAQYKGPRSGLDKAGFLAAINDLNNWDSQDAGGDQSKDGIVPDLPFNTTAFVIGAAGTDTNPPVVSSAVLRNGNTIQVLISEAVTRASVTNSANYSLEPSLAIGNIAYDSVGRSVTLTTASPLSNGVIYRLSVKGLVDLAPTPNTMSTTFVSSPLLWNGYTGEDLVISEIMYNAGTGTDSLEFIEIYNRSNQAIPMGGLRLSRSANGVLGVYTLPAKGLYIIASDSLRAGRFYGKSFKQWGTGFLNNNGAAIVLSNSAGVVLDSVNYDDAAPWPITPDGTGPSLELSDANADNNVGSNWLASLTETGKSVNSVAILASPGVYKLTVGTREIGRPAHSFKVYPNPARERLYFSKVLSGNVYNVMGQWVRRFQKVDQVEVHGFAKGMYVLQAENGEYIRFVVE
jgi:hypothetical protein